MYFKYKVSKDINWIAEITILIGELLNKKEEILEKNYNLVTNDEVFLNSKESVNEIFSDVYTFRKNVIEEVAPLVIDNKFWEALGSYENYGFGQYSVLFNALPNDLSKNYSDITEEEFLKNIITSVVANVHVNNEGDERFATIEDGTYKNSNWDLNNIKIDFNDIFELLEASTYTDSTRLEILRIIKNPKESREKFIKLFSKIEKIIKKHLHLVEERINNLYDFLNTDEGKKKLEETFRINEENFLGINEELKKDGRDLDYITLYVGVCGYNSGSIKISVEEDSIPWAGIGLILFELSDLKEGAKHNSNKIIDMTKALGDRTRFKILEVLMERPYYLKELAEKLDTSSASLSHHINLLFQADFITLKVEDRKSYYCLNKKAFEGLGKMLINLSKEEENVNLE